MQNQYRFETLQLHAGQEIADPTTHSRAVPIYQTTSYLFDSCQHAADLFDLKAEGNIYSRMMNPTTDTFEARINALEGGVGALALSSGSAAVTYAIQNITQMGDHIVSANTLYGGTYNLFAHTLPKSGITTTFVNPDDVSNFEKAKEIVEESIETFGYIDILVNNAGITKDGLFMRMSEQDFDAVLNTNLKGSFNITRHTINHMIKKRCGAIINISSIVGVMGNAGQANYAASKAGVIGMTKSVAREVASRGITCNAIAPGFIKTDMTAVLKEDIVKQMIAQIPMKKLGQAEDVAETAVFLAKSKYITGQVIHVNGGMAMY